jgi:hypothetical protein
MELEERMRAYLRKARAAENNAETAADAEVRRVWAELARSWKLLARHLRSRNQQGEPP